jgi:hypothetical protein
MAEPSLAMQRAIYDALTADLLLAEVMGGAVRVYDLVPADASFPYITIGDDQALDAGVSCEPDMWEYFSTIHVWSRATIGAGRIEAKFIAGLTREILKTPPAAPGFNVHLSQCERLDHLRDPDGLSAHSIVTMRFLISIV